ncbi:hypothetical protein [Rosistilla oblonga]|uniref:Peptidase family M50 n=1 Tax=Rosistilla oblonga TaxID=2527990 RepID=A0A518IUL4_9BACT|nr:hypothetical protein [Rosistilla oblonga]QDV56781.1 Peptidase family M50 [Rosistilla oblonga]
MRSPSQIFDFTPSGLRLGRWRGTTYAIGWSYLGLGAVLFVAAWWLKVWPGNQDLPWLALVVWLAIGIVGGLQESAHAVTAWLLGGKSRLMMIAGHGGAGQYRIFGGPRQAIVAAAGPTSSCLFALLVAGILMFRGEASLWQMLDPLRPPELVGRLNLVSIGKVVAWIAITLSVVQMLPLWRCDGRTLLDGLVATFRPHYTPSARAHAATVAIGWIAFAMVGLSLAVAMFEDRQGVPRWPVLAAVGLVLWMSGQKVDPRIRVIDAKHQPIGWLGARRIRQAHHREIREASDIAKLDAILDRMTQHGADSLSHADRAVLKRASAALKKHSGKS